MVIGFRSFTDGFAYVVLDGRQSEPEVLAKERLWLPKGQNWPACLAWVRKQLSEVLQKFDINGACIKTIEPIAMKKSAKRLQIEAVILEYFQSAKSIDCTTKIKSQLKRDIRGFTDSARYLPRILTEISVLSQLNTAQYDEATIAAVSELPEA